MNSIGRASQKSIKRRKLRSSFCVQLLVRYQAGWRRGRRKRNSISTVEKAFSKRIYLYVVHHIECRVAIFQRQIEPYFTSLFFQLLSPLLVTAGEELLASARPATHTREPFLPMIEKKVLPRWIKKPASASRLRNPIKALQVTGKTFFHPTRRIGTCSSG